MFVTSAIVAHDDKFLSPELRKGARMVIFTQSQVFLAATGKDSVGFSNQEKKDVQEISKLVFGDDAKVTSLKKVCYDRESVPPFKYFIADKHDSFKLGGQAVWEFAAKIPSQKEGLDKKTLNHLLGIQKPAQWSSSPTIKW